MPGTLQLRMLQTLVEIATEKNSTIIFPVPVDLIAQFLPGAQEAMAARQAAAGGAASPPPQPPAVSPP